MCSSDCSSVFLFWLIFVTKTSLFQALGQWGYGQSSLFRSIPTDREPGTLATIYCNAAMQPIIGQQHNNKPYAQEFFAQKMVDQHVVSFAMDEQLKHAKWHAREAQLSQKHEEM